MEECELQGDCVFLAEHRYLMPSTVTMVRQRYCDWNRNACARYFVSTAIGRDFVPPDMLPYQQDRARQIIKFGPQMF